MPVEIILAACAFCMGVLLDALIGDPHSLPHPVRAIGTLITILEKRLRSVFPGTPAGEFAAGVFLVIITTGLTGAGAYLFLTVPARTAAHFFGEGAGYICRFLAESLSVFYFLAIRSLRDESTPVARALLEHDLPAARRAVSMIVGRDTERLDEEGVAMACVETVAEGTSDGVVSPLFWYAAAGPAGAWVYKAVNTMDSMVGYRNEKYLFFGRAAARTDDAANWLSSRLAALLMILSAFLLNMDGKSAWRIWRRDRRKHKSPNSAQTESVCAGALGLRLAGDAWYSGTLVKKPWLGDRKKPCTPEDIGRAQKLMTLTSYLMAVLALAVRILLLTVIWGG